MDFNEGSDVLMGDGDILASTEKLTRLNGNELDAGIPSMPGTDPDTMKSPTPPLKGPGLKRNIPSIFDQQLTLREDVPRPPKFNNLPYATAQTGLVYDVRMRFHVEPIPKDQDIHPEDPRRIFAIFDAFQEAGLAWREGFSQGPPEQYMGRIDARMVTKQEACLVHSEAHWNWIQTLASKTGEELEEELQHPHLYASLDSVYLSPSTPFCAALSAGGAIEACRAVMLGKVKNAFAVIRPPGHHAERDDVKGFCFYDNVSIATKVCKAEFGDACRKVLILDWDVHHGNGIQQAHYSDPNVLYISLHVHLGGQFYPERSYYDERQHKPYGDHLHVGEGNGEGKNINIPWRKTGMKDGDYLYAFQQVIMPVATEFDPDLVIIAAGFDAAEGDMLGGCHVTPSGYAHMTHMLMSLANGKVAVCLEGGYNLDSIARSATAVARTLMGEPPDRILDSTPTKTGVDDVKMVARHLSKYWSCLYPKDMSERLKGPLGGERMHDVVRKYQASNLWEKHEMVPLYIRSTGLSKSFENQVLATPNYSENRPLLIILHDPPDILTSPDQRTGRIELHNTWLTDVVKTYIDWAVEQGFGVIDVNLPKHFTGLEDEQAHADSDSVESRTKEAAQLLTYLWENYVQVNDVEQVFLMGTNTGHGAIINFIKANEEVAQVHVYPGDEAPVPRIMKAISFVEDVPLQSCKSSTLDALASWYYQSSLVFVSKKHNFWQSDFVRKPKKRFGQIQQSVDEDINSMLVAHRNAVIEAILEDTEDWRNKRPVQEEEAPGTPVPASKLPPIANFALSPARQGTRSPHLSSPGKNPSFGNFAASPKPLSGPRSPFR
ncbi:histone deacetylase HdaA [Acrodontium crateriforme]|uniref:Histone deacetylase n=1 Tax=Acrodontium crateriforme TaxID=150365 RepID=A0AAQ3MDQ4_9PEZI|nr:histone deacetylase HdaA [Acrodontium crateriforme]